MTPLQLGLFLLHVRAKYGDSQQSQTPTNHNFPVNYPHMARIIFSFAPAVNVILHPNTISTLQACSPGEQREEKFASP